MATTLSVIEATWLTSRKQPATFLVVAVKDHTLTSILSDGAYRNFTMLLEIAGTMG
jgi:hypothetical protein